MQKKLLMSISSSCRTIFREPAARWITSVTGCDAVWLTAPAHSRYVHHGPEHTDLANRSKIFPKRPEYKECILSLRLPVDCLEYFDKHRNVLRPPEYCLIVEQIYVTSLHLYAPSAFSRKHRGYDEDHSASISDSRQKPRVSFFYKFKIAESKDWLTCATLLFNREEFIKLIGDIGLFVERFQPSDLIASLHYLMLLDFMDYDLLLKAEPSIILGLPEFESDDISKVAAVYMSNGRGSRDLHYELLHVMRQRAGKMNNLNLASICESMSKARILPVEFMRAMLPDIKRKYQELNGREMSLVAYAYAKCPNALDSRVFMMHLIKEISRKHLRFLTGHSLVRTIWASASVLPEYPDLLEKAEAQLLPAIPQMSGRGVATLLWSYSRVDTGSIQLYVALKERAMATCYNMNPQSLSTSLRALAKTLGRTISANGDIDCEFHEAAEARVKTLAAQFTPEEIAATINAYSMVHAGSTELHNILQGLVIQNASSFSSNEIATILFAFASIRGGTKVFKVLQADVLEQLTQFTTHDLSVVFWSFIVMRFHDKKFCETLLELFSPAQTAGDDRCALLFPALVDVANVIPSLNDDRLRRLQGYTKEAFWNLQLSEYSAVFAEEIASALRAVGIKCCCCYDHEGFLIDVFVEELSGCKVAIICHTPLSLHRNSGRPLAQSVMRKRCLSRADFTIVNISWEHWKCAPDNVEDRVISIKGMTAASMKKANHEGKELSSQL